MLKSGLVVAVLACGLVLGSGAKQARSEPMKEVAPVLNFQMKSLDGKNVDLSKYAGKVVLIVNVASKCGNTPQYKPLEEIYKKYQGQGFVILGFPANEFGHQEPGTDTEISSFCTKNYGVDFDMFSKVIVKGEGQCALYQYLTSPKTDPRFAGDITWNFEKFLIGRNGEIVNRFTPRTQPQDPAVISAIEHELAK